MQDGLFKAGDLTYKIVRAIFVFSGGTSYTFSQFLGKGNADPKFCAPRGRISSADSAVI